MEFTGYLASILIGVLLGLIGGGGSILTVPVLVYLFGISAELSTVYSLFIVGFGSAVGSFSYFRNRWVDFKTCILFGLPSILAVYFTRQYLLPIMPSQINFFDVLSIDKNTLLMLVFAVLMLLASYHLIKKCVGPGCLPCHSPKTANFLLLIQGALVGIITGLIGAGGGFLIIPALVKLMGLDIKKAIGTSLSIVAVNSFFGFMISAPKFDIDWLFLSQILALVVLGLLVGHRLSQKTDSTKLKPIFGWFVLFMGLLVLLSEIFLK